MSIKLATLAGGCFWCLEAIFEELDGVIKVVPGYSGGNVDNPCYEEVCTGKTNHAEVVQIFYDTDNISFKDILEIFFDVHNPTTLNRQGAEVGTQYRSAIFYHSPEQKEIAEDLIPEVKKIWGKDLLTEITPFEKFFPAEEYHHNYFHNHPEQAYCNAVISPKLLKFRKKYKDN